MSAAVDRGRRLARWLRGSGMPATEAERGQERYRRIALSSVASVAAQGASVLSGLILTPVTLAYLGAERFGLWMALSSVLTSLFFSDLGMGIGLQNALAACLGRGDREKPRGFVTSAIAAMGMMCALLVLAALIGLPHWPLDRLIRVASPQAAADLLPTTQVMLIVFGTGLVVGLAPKVFQAHQQGYLESLWLTVGRVAGLVCVLLLIPLQASLPMVAGTFMAVPYVAMAFGGWLYFREHRWLRPSWGAVRAAQVRDIMSTGAMALGAQIAFTILVSGVPLVMSSRLGTLPVASYSVTMRLMGFANVLLLTGMLPLWPAYGEAAARGDWHWVRKTFARSVRISAMIQVPVFVVFAGTGQWLIRLWTRNDAAVPSFSLLMACNVWWLLMAFNLSASTLLNALGHMRGQAVYGSLCAVAGVAVGYVLAEPWGAEGVVWGTVTVGLLLRLLFMAFEVQRVLRQVPHGASAV